MNANSRSNGFPVRCVQELARILSGLTFFSSAGFRHSATGALTSAGSEGRFWLAVSSGAGSVRMGFDGAGLSFIDIHRTFGFSLRCVQALTGVVSG